MMPVLFEIQAEVCCCVLFGPARRSLVKRMLNAPMGCARVGVCNWAMGLLVKAAVGMAFSVLVGWGMGMVVGYVVIVFSGVPGSILIALPPTSANLPCRPTTFVQKG